MKTRAHPQNRFLRIIGLPFRALGKAKDFYVRSITNCSDRVGYGGGIGVSAPLPRSFSSKSSISGESEDFAELVRAASGKGVANKIDVELYLQQQMMMRNGEVAKSRKMPRSSSVAMGKIDEDKPFIFGEENVGLKTEMNFPRSRSYAPTKRNAAF